MSDSLTYTAEDWEQIRSRFASSPMAGMDMQSLAENAGYEWHNNDQSDTPENYLILSWDELQMHPDVADPKKLKTLLDILKETLAFDDPFGDMFDPEQEAKEEDDLQKAIRKLEIPEDYPLSLTNLSAETQEFCKGEGVETVGQFAELSRRMAQNVVIGGDFKDFLNALSTMDENTLARYIPFRPGSTGLHLVEAVGLVVDSLEPSQRATLYKIYGLKPLRSIDATPLSGNQAAALETGVKNALDKFLTRFSEERADLERAALQEGELEAKFQKLKDGDKEQLAVAIARHALTGQSAPSQRGLFGRLKKGLFG